MTIDEAIKRLQRQIGLTSPTIEPGLIETLKLGREALKQIKALRYTSAASPQDPLPGETKD